MQSVNVSVIITTHNRKNLLIKAIDSVLNQTYKNLECIVVDDASSDDTYNAIKGYIDNASIAYIRINEDETKGGNYARNLGILASSGDYVAFLDDDDEWMPTKIEKQVMVSKTTGAGFVYCGRMYSYDGQRAITYDDIMNNQKFPEGNLSSESIVRTITVTSTMFIKKHVLIDSGLFDENLFAWQDYEMAIRVLQNTCATLIRENLVLYRQATNDKNKISENIDKWEDSVAYIEKKHAALISKLPQIDKNRRLLYKYIDGYNRANASRIGRKKVYYASKILFSPRILRIAVMKKLFRNAVNY